jgi:hypothetical protein
VSSENSKNGGRKEVDVELKDAMKLANALADLTEAELQTVTTFAAKLRERSGKTEPKAKRKYTKKEAAPEAVKDPNRPKRKYTKRAKPTAGEEAQAREDQRAEEAEETTSGTYEEAPNRH